MPLPAPQSADKKQFPKHPEGSAQIVLADVFYLGHRIIKEFGTDHEKPQERAVLIFQSAELDPSGKRFELAQEFTWSSHEKANLRKFLAPWIGPFASDTIAKQVLMSLDSQIGLNGIANIVHNPSKTDPDKVYVNIASVGKPMKGMQPIQVEGYTRNEYWEKKRAQYAADVQAWEQKKLAAQAGYNAATAKEKVEAGDFSDFPAALPEGVEEDLPFGPMVK